MLHPASPIYEVLIGTGLLALVSICVLSVPTIYALWVDKKEQELRTNTSGGETNESRI